MKAGNLIQSNASLCLSFRSGHIPRPRMIYGWIVVVVADGREGKIAATTIQPYILHGWGIWWDVAGVGKGVGRGQAGCVVAHGQWIFVSPWGRQGGRGGGGSTFVVCLSLPGDAFLQDEEGTIMLTFPQPMEGFRDFLYYDEQLQISIGNRGSLTIIQQ